MEKIDKLTPEQEVLVEQTRDRWVNALNTFDFNSLTDEKIDRITTLCRELHRVCGIYNYETLKVYVTKSPYEAKRLSKELSGETQTFSSYVNYSDSGWLAFYDFLTEIDFKIDSDVREKCLIIKELILSGVFMIIQLDEAYIISLPPTNISFDKENNLHSTTTGAITFSDGYKQHYVHGRFIEEDIFNDCFDLKNANIRFMSENNEDIKSIIAYIVRDNFGNEGLMEMLGASLYKEQTVKHSDTYTETLRIYRTKNTYSFLQNQKGEGDQPYCWLEYTCPSTGTIYLIDTFSDFETPLEAAKFHRPAEIPFELPYEWTIFSN